MEKTMTSETLTSPLADRGYLTEKGFWSWAYTLDHKRIGLIYLCTTLIFLMVGGVFALLLRLKLMTPGQELFSDHAYNVFFTLHGIMMIFLFIIPAIPSALGNFFIPLMVGARDVAFPRLNIFSYWIFVAGVIVTLCLPGEPAGHRLDLLHPLFGQDRAPRSPSFPSAFSWWACRPSSPA